jgi:putative transposase
MLRAYKYRIYPNKEQVLFLSNTFGAARFIYNKMLYDKIEHYKQTGQTLNNTPAQYKSDFPWLKEVDSLALANEQLNLQKAYKNFFRDKKVGFPKYKSKKKNYFSFTTNNQKGTVSIEDGLLKVPKLKSRIKIKVHRPLLGDIRSCTISKTPTGKYYASILVNEEIMPLPKASDSIGIDVGIKTFATLSTGEFIDNPKWLRKSEKRLIRLQRNLSRKQKGSKNRYKARLKVARLHEKIKNQRNDFLHKTSTILIRENQALGIEDLRVKNMLKNHKLAKAISEVSWAEFRRLLEYKSNWYGRQLTVAPSNYASSQLCSDCGHKNPLVKNLKVRQWICPNCGVSHDRDVNAAKNLLKLVT